MFCLCVFVCKRPVWRCLDKSLVLGDLCCLFYVLTQSRTSVKRFITRSSPHLQQKNKLYYWTYFLSSIQRHFIKAGRIKSWMLNISYYVHEALWCSFIPTTAVALSEIHAFTAQNRHHEAEMWGHFPTTDSKIPDFRHLTDTLIWKTSSSSSSSSSTKMIQQ